MMIEVMKSKLHCVTVTEANLNYMGSITIDEDLMDAANMIAGEKVQVLDNNNGERFETYIIKGERGSGCICLNGAAARRVPTWILRKQRRSNLRWCSRKRGTSCNSNGINIKIRKPLHQERLSCIWCRMELFNNYQCIIFHNALAWLYADGSNFTILFGLDVISHLHGFQYE